MGFLLTNNLLLANIDNRKHTFQRYDGRGTLKFVRQGGESNVGDGRLAEREEGLEK